MGYLLLAIPMFGGAEGEHVLRDYLGFKTVAVSELPDYTIENLIVCARDEK